MFWYTLKRIVLVIPVILGVILIVFLFQAVSPNDPVDQLLGQGATQEQKDELQEELGLDDPIVVQYVRYIWNIISKGSLGTSYKTNEAVTTEIASRFPYTVRLAIGAVFLGVLIGIPLGVLSAVKQYTLVDGAILTYSVLCMSMPSFWLALILIQLFAVRLGWLPVYGIGTAKGWILPYIIVSIACSSDVIRITRSSLLESIRQDYVRTARAKGQKEYIVIIRHALRNSLIPIVASIGNSIGVQLGGALVIETVFGIPGIGKYAVDAISARNYPAVTGAVVVLATTFTLVNLIVDLMYTVVDPRLKRSFSIESPLAKLKKKKEVA
ncbi:MAG: ABC transporter permease [Oscillospiraceae bacterium]|nr:ABC transporter permease [Oscillospiraceae bacterium]